MSKPESKAIKKASAGAPDEAPGKAAEEIESRANKVVSHSVTAVSLSPDERHLRISLAAYRRAEERGFAPGNALEDWLAAEREVDSALNA
jgi:hypothetical protein